MFSKHVDDSSVIHLQKLTKPVFLNFDGTNVTPMGYGRIICTLPKLRKPTWAKIVDAVLLTVTKVEIETAKSLTGIVRNLCNQVPVHHALIVARGERQLVDIRSCVCFYPLILRL